MRLAAEIVVLALLAVLPGQAARAEPRNGFGLAGGLTAHRARYTFADGSFVPYTSAGLSLGGDAQFAVDERWSLNPYLLLSLERNSGDLAGTIGNGAAGFEVRRWRGPLFLGLRAGYYVQLLSTTRATSTAYGPGLGVSFGGESAEGLTWGAALDVLRLGTFVATHVGLRLHVGWRWY
jgi:hypothetical protein